MVAHCRTGMPIVARGSSAAVAVARPPSVCPAATSPCAAARRTPSKVCVIASASAGTPAGPSAPSLYPAPTRAGSHAEPLARISAANLPTSSACAASGRAGGWPRVQLSTLAQTGRATAAAYTVDHSRL